MGIETGVILVLAGAVTLGKLLDGAGGLFSRRISTGEYATTRSRSHSDDDDA